MLLKGVNKLIMPYIAQKTRGHGRIERGRNPPPSTYDLII
uniref:Uncharacterized protein n=1 Tax=Rhizophora mucronata TaxID=61149 RepID=A0A2P2PNZ6_RHIMU